MFETIALIAAAISARALGAMVRGYEHAVLTRIAGWMACVVGAWLFTSAAGAWFPIWPIVLIGALGSAIHIGLARPQPTMALSDAAVVLVCGGLSIPALAPHVLLATVASFMLIGKLVDQLQVRVSCRIRQVSFQTAVVLAAGAFVTMDRTAAGGAAGAWHRSSPLVLFHTCIGRPLYGERAEIATESGRAVAWIDRPRLMPPGGQRPGAIVFHGNDRAGSRQPAALAIRRALLHAGYVVLSLDHPGYGESALPENINEVQSWDPAPFVRAALARLRQEQEVGPILAVGHSMGALDALRACSGEGEMPDGIVLFGMAAFDPRVPGDVWLSRFLRSRNLRVGSLDAESGAAVRQYYDMEQLLGEVGRSMPPCVFVRFGMEHENVVVGRDRALELLGDRAVIWDLAESTHYFSASERLRINFGDGRVTRKLAERFKSYQSSSSTLLLSN